MPTFHLIDRPALTFEIVRTFNAGGFVPSVVGVTQDGKRTTTARLADVVMSAPSDKALIFVVVAHGADVCAFDDKRHANEMRRDMIERGELADEITVEARFN